MGAGPARVAAVAIATTVAAVLTCLSTGFVDTVTFFSLVRWPALMDRQSPDARAVAGAVTRTFGQGRNSVGRQAELPVRPQTAVAVLSGLAPVTEMTPLTCHVTH
ncbi:hypothetical protein GCM10012286_81010 [Streptomyces lasiicapitis]|uniref:Uncharacterized protein n=1 Tax=Streptomyces lasiicapitis TaxID=1923961 RepID=A0ABQ2MWQ4_9ACTN|nr:hypothetical protein GCM10012286_81010 [Streptomyces lasiicapitis]